MTFVSITREIVSFCVNVPTSKNFWIIYLWTSAFVDDQETWKNLHNSKYIWISWSTSIGTISSKTLCLSSLLASSSCCWMRRELFWSPLNSTMCPNMSYQEVSTWSSNRSHWYILGGSNLYPYENFERLPSKNSERLWIPSDGIDDDYRSAVLMLQNETSYSIAWFEIG